MRIVTCIICLLLSIVFSSAQTIPNNSFETIDSTGKPAGWVLKQGTLLRSTALVRNGIPFLPSDQNFFVSLENDTVSTPAKAGTLQHSFVFTDTPRTMLFDAVYVPTYAYQRYAVELVLTKWRNSQRDTILQKQFVLGPVLDSNNIVYTNWSRKSLDLVAGYRDTVSSPDSATMTILCDFETPLVNTTYLLLDHFRFSNWRTGIASPPSRIDFYVYPNPCEDDLHIEVEMNGNSKITAFVSDVTGRVLIAEHFQGRAHSLDLSSLRPGIYFLCLQNQDGGMATKKIALR